ncbi:hypothetical protein BD310DRAFT_242085 [Dichomitus squalens]|uniref:Uncharacterized protein n=1 Tax=Dichomitus squalens TaxID=114155 RepID=A0A4Q9PGN9_9APHY|nr:hypothetical protein BD310DRAFT_242085 [Dichomitus squalens]
MHIASRHRTSPQLLETSLRVASIPLLIDSTGAFSGACADLLSFLPASDAAASLDDH